MRLLDILPQKNYLLRTIIQCNNIFVTNILSGGYPTKLKIYRNSRGWGVMTSTPYVQCIMEIPGGSGGGSKVNMPFVGGMDIFWYYTVIDMLLARFLVASF